MYSLRSVDVMSCGKMMGVIYGCHPTDLSAIPAVGWIGQPAHWKKLRGNFRDCDVVYGDFSAGCLWGDGVSDGSVHGMGL